MEDVTLDQDANAESLSLTEDKRMKKWCCERKCKLVVYIKCKMCGIKMTRKNSVKLGNSLVCNGCFQDIDNSI